MTNAHRLYHLTHKHMHFHYLLWNEPLLVLITEDNSHNFFKTGRQHTVLNQIILISMKCVEQVYTQKIMP